MEVPKHGNSVFASGRAQGTVGGHGHGVDVSVVSRQVGLEGQLGGRPDLHHLVPSARHDEGVLGVGGETGAGHPVVVTVLVEVELAGSEGVPHL